MRKLVFALILCLKIAAFCVLFVMLVYGLNILVVPHHTTGAKNYREFYEQQDLDTIFLGTSSTYRAIIPAIYDEELGTNSFNLGTPAQPPEAAYYWLKEAIRTNPIERVVYNVSPSIFRRDESPYEHLLLTITNMQWSDNKVKMILDTLEMDNFADGFISAYYSREFFRIEEIQENLDPPESTSKVPEEVLPHLGKGYRYSAKKQKAAQTDIGRYEDFTEENRNQESLGYLQKIIDLCKEEDIELVLGMMPRAPGNILYNVEYYQEYHEYMKEVAAENDLFFLDFNYLRPEFIQYTDRMFMDFSHPNYSLAVPLSQLHTQMLQEIENNTFDYDTYFFGTIEEYTRIQNRLAGINLKSYKESTATATIGVGAGYGVVVHYQFSLGESEDGPFEVIQPYSEDNKCVIGTEYHGKYWLKVEAKDITESEDPLVFNFVSSVNVPKR